LKRRVTYIISDIDKALAFEWIAKYLDKNAFELSFILLLQEPAYLETYLKEAGIPCHSIYYRSKKDFPGVVWKLLRLLWSIRPAVVHCHLFTASLLGLTAAKLIGIRKRIYTRHHSDYHHRYFPGGIKWDKWCNMLATHIVAPSKAVRDVLVNMEGVNLDKVVIIHHGFELDYFRKTDPGKVSGLAEQYETAGHFPIVGVISRFTELKGIQYIIPAFQRLLLQYPEAKILFFNARGDYERVLLGMLSELPERSYSLIPFENDLASAYQLMDIFIQASTDYSIEAFGQTYVEALAAGIPSVFTLSGIAQDFIEDDKNALVVPFKDSDAIFSAMTRLLGDKGLRDRLRQDGMISVQSRFELKNMIAGLEELYR